MQTDVAISLLYERITMLETEYNKERDRADAAQADLLRVAQAADAEARQQRGALRAALQSILAIAEARSDGTWDDVMRTARAALEDPTP
jgi:hypothetical protein